MVTLVIAVMLLTSAGFTLGSTGIETLFFARYGVQYLPGMYMLLGVLSFLTTMGITALLGRVRRELLYTFIPIGILLAILIAWLALAGKSLFVYPVLWLGKEVANTLFGLVLWGIAGTVCDTRQSKRLFPLFNAGRILGSVLGGFVVGALAGLIGTKNVLLAWAVTLLLAFWCSRTLLKNRAPAAPERKSRRRPEQASFLQDLQRGYHSVRSSELMRWISLASVLFSILYFSIALPFSKSAAARFPDENALAGFLGLFNGLSTAAAFLVSMFLANRLYLRIGILNAILALPLIYLAGFGALAISSAFAVVVLFRFAQMLWLSGVADSAYQAVFNAVPVTQRDYVRAFIGGVPEQAGTFLAGLTLIIGEAAFSARGLALIGLVAAALTAFSIWKAGRAYQRALVESLQAGQLTLFESDNHSPVPLDNVAIRVALQGLHDQDALLRRTSAEILSNLDLPEVTAALMERLGDEDVEVRLAALRGLAGREPSAKLLKQISTLLGDPSPRVRAQVVDALHALSPHQPEILALIRPLLSDEESAVRVRAAVALSSLDGEQNSPALLRRMVIQGSLDERLLALQALVETGDAGSFNLFASELENTGAPSAVRRAAATALGHCGAQAIPVLKAALATGDLAVQAGIADAFGRLGEPALASLLEALTQAQTEPAALLALEKLPAWKAAGQVRQYAGMRVASALRYDGLRQALDPQEDGRVGLLEESLWARARRDGIFALRAISTLGDRETITTAIKTLQNRNKDNYSNALEALEGLRCAELIRPLFSLWEPAQVGKPAGSTREIATQLLNEDDPWLLACAHYAANGKDQSMDALVNLTLMDRVLWLRRVPLLADLTPSDLQRVAAISSELVFADGDLLGEQGEAGEEMFVILSGEVRVLVNSSSQARKEIARRVSGDVVGEMSIISGDARTASLVASGEVRVLCLDRQSFESLLRERPEVSMAVMRELCHRLQQMM